MLSQHYSLIMMLHSCRSLTDWGSRVCADIAVGALSNGVVVVCCTDDMHQQGHCVRPSFRNDSCEGMCWPDAFRLHTNRVGLALTKPVPNEPDQQMLLTPCAAALGCSNEPTRQRGLQLRSCKEVRARSFLGILEPGTEGQRCSHHACS